MHQRSISLRSCFFYFTETSSISFVSCANVTPSLPRLYVDKREGWNTMARPVSAAVAIVHAPTKGRCRCRRWRLSASVTYTRPTIQSNLLATPTPHKNRENPCYLDFRAARLVPELHAWPGLHARPSRRGRWRAGPGRRRGGPWWTYGRRTTWRPRWPACVHAHPSAVATPYPHGHIHVLAPSY